MMRTLLDIAAPPGVTSTDSRGPKGLLALAALLTLLVPAPASQAAGVDGIQICHGFGCRNQDTISITDREWAEIKAFFRKPAATPEAERDQIRKASGWFEVIAGRYTPIHRDKGQNQYPDRYEKARLDKDEHFVAAGTRGQMDCIDESLNMTTYLTLMEQAGLFRHHKVVERAHRQSAVDQHYAGQLEEIGTGTRWVVDSWFYDYGSLPYVEEATEWHDIPFLFSTSFPEGSDG